MKTGGAAVIGVFVQKSALMALPFRLNANTKQMKSDENEPFAATA